MKNKHKKILKLSKGFRGRAKNVYSVAVNRVEKALQYAYVGRKIKKRDFRSLWIQQVNAGVRQHGMAYSRFVPALNAADIVLNRKVLADLAATEPASFKAVVEVARAVSEAGVEE